MSNPAEHDPTSGSVEQATFASGCFWCTEGVFLQLEGVRSAVPGYTGGQVPNPTYEQVCTGATGHAEAVEIAFDPAVISYAELLEVFWQTHDPTTLNRQGNDVGTQYRSAIYYHNEAQREAAETSKRRHDEANTFGAPIVTEIAPASQFYPAEAYHHDYYAQNPRQPYCMAVVRPKIDKAKKLFADKLKAT